MYESTCTSNVAAPAWLPTSLAHKAAPAPSFAFLGVHPEDQPHLPRSPLLSSNNSNTAYLLVLTPINSTQVQCRSRQSGLIVCHRITTGMEDLHNLTGSRASSIALYHDQPLHHLAQEQCARRTQSPLTTSTGYSDRT